MKPKKSYKADLERKRLVFFQMGLLCALALTLVAFEWKQEARVKQSIYIRNHSGPDVTEVPPPTFPESQPEIVPLPPQIDFTIVPDNLNLPDDFVVFDNSTVHENSIFMIPVQESPEAPVEEPFVNPEFPPDFQGEGIEGFWKWVQQHIAYPREAIGLNLQGTVYIEFIVNKEGQVSHARVVKGVDSLLDTEVLRVVRSSPRWTPGMQGINKVNVKFTIPVTFLLK